jgi:hypothetical protein
MVFWRDMGWNEEEEAVEARDGVCNIVDIIRLEARYNKGVGRYDF